MFSIKFILSLALLVLAGCGSIQDDLLPSGSNKVPAIQPGTTGHSVGQYAPDFTVSDALGNTITLSSETPAHRGVVLYFTMWCPTCFSEMDIIIRDIIVPLNTDVVFFAVDYVSGTIQQARNAQMDNGYDGSGFIVLADIAHTIQNEYNGTMGKTVVIDKNGIVRMNELFNGGSKLQSVLGGLP